MRRENCNTIFSISRNASLALDLLIMFQTIKIVLLGRGRAMKAVFWIAGAVVFYAYLGYAVWLWIGAC